MQAWFFFSSGAGGDGIVNLFERSNNVVPFDGESDWWRVHRIVDSKPKFYAPTPDIHGCFRSKTRFSKTTNRLDTGYYNCVTLDQNCVVASHDVTLQALSASDCQDIFCKNQVKILLTVDDYQKKLVNAAVKNLVPSLPRTVEPIVDQNKFDIVLDVDKIQTDWQYVLDFCKDIKFNLELEQYLQYQDLLKGNKTYMTNNFGIEEYTSQIVGNNITYTLVNTWQSTAT